jgi:hypothetical protein
MPLSMKNAQNFRGETRDDLALAIPAVAHGRLARLPRCLSERSLPNTLFPPFCGGRGRRYSGCKCGRQSERKKSRIACLSVGDKALNFRITAVASDSG